MHNNASADIQEAKTEWTHAKDALVSTIADLGFPAELGEAAARHLGSPKAIRRMTSYLHQARPDRAELIADEMLAIRAEIDAWKARKNSIQSGVRYNEMLWYGLGEESEGPEAE